MNFIAHRSSYESKKVYRQYFVTLPFSRSCSRYKFCLYFLERYMQVQCSLLKNTKMQFSNRKDFNLKRYKALKLLKLCYVDVEV